MPRDCWATAGDGALLCAPRQYQTPDRRGGDRDDRNADAKHRQRTSSRERSRAASVRIAKRVERKPKIGGRLEPVRRLLLEAAADDARKRLGHGGERRDIRRVGMQRRVQRVDRRLALKCTPSGEQLEQHAPEGEDVGTLIDYAATNLLRRHVPGQSRESSPRR